VQERKMQKLSARHIIIIIKIMPSKLQEGDTKNKTKNKSYQERHTKYAMKAQSTYHNK